MLGKEEIKRSIIETADEFGEIVFLDSPPDCAIEMVREGRLVRVSYFVFSLPEGG